MKSIGLSNRAIIVLCFFATAVCLILDLAVPTGIVMSVFYAGVVFLALLSRHIWYAYWAATGVSVLIVFDFLLRQPGDDTFWIYLANRIIAISLVWLTAILGAEYKKGERMIWFLAALVNSSEESIVGKDTNGVICSWNKGAERLYGYTDSEMVGQSVTKLIPEDRQAEEVEILRRLNNGEYTMNLETERLTKNGERIPVSLTISPIRDRAHKIMGASTISRSISTQKEREAENESYRQALAREVAHRTAELEEKNRLLFETIDHQKATEAELRTSQDNLRRLAEHLNTIIERERASIAREAHDQLGQLLTALKMDLAWLNKHVTDKPADVQGRMTEMAGLINETITSVQQIVSRLRPGILDDLGLIEAVKWQAREYERRTGIACQVDSDCDNIAMEPDIATSIFRIVQETLTNAARHAEATSVHMTISCDPETIRIGIRDNGKGITPAKIYHANSFGLMGMRERCLISGGQFEIRPGQDNGTVVSMTMPLKNEKIQETPV